MSTSFPPPPEARPRSKPFWNRWWFWVIAIVLVPFAIGVASGDTDNTMPSTTPTQTVEPATMPNLVGLTIPEALEAMDPFGIHTIGTTERPSVGQKTPS